MHLEETIVQIITPTYKCLENLLCQWCWNCH